MMQHVQHVCALIGGEGIHAKIKGNLGANIEQGAHEYLRAMGSFGNSELAGQILVTLKIDLGAVNCEDSASMPAGCTIEVSHKQLEYVLEELAEQIGLDLVPGLAEGGSGDSVVLRQGQAKGSCFVPEVLEQESVPTAIAICNHVEDQCEEQLRGQGSVSAEVSTPTAKLLALDSASEGRKEIEKTSLVDRLGMAIALTICVPRLLAIVSFCIFSSASDLLDYHVFIVL